ncbi:MAG: class D sortase [Clostridia bacterium]|nr:class D sortase [Clostridia bacterium]
MKSRITHIVIIVVLIVVLSIVAIFIKDLFSKNDLQKLATTQEIANTLVNVPDAPQVGVKPEESNEDIITVKKGAIAVIDIPSVGIRAQVVEGTDDESLKNYIGKFDGCAYPGEYGNFSAAAHNNIYTEIFRNLHKVQIGSQVRVITRTKEFIYKITSVEKIEPTRIDVLNENSSVQEITLITCSDMAKSRICVKGTLVSANDI